MANPFDPSWVAEAILDKVNSKKPSPSTTPSTSTNASTKPSPSTPTKPSKAPSFLGKLISVVKAGFRNAFKLNTTTKAKYTDPNTKSHTNH